MMRMCKRPTARAIKLANAPELPVEKVCVCCGMAFERPEFTKDGRRHLRPPQQWRRQRFCSPQCVKEYRLHGTFKESLPSYLACLEPETPGPQR